LLKWAYLSFVVLVAIALSPTALAVYLFLGFAEYRADMG
jgi:hypothetical protein